MINETYFSVMFHESRPGRIPPLPPPTAAIALLFSLLSLVSTSFRAKKTSDGDDDGRRDWFSVPVPSSSGCGLQVTGLSPATDYQFSVLSHNKMGTGPFSEIAAARTSGQ